MNESLPGKPEVTPEPQNCRERSSELSMESLRPHHASPPDGDFQASAGAERRAGDKGRNESRPAIDPSDWIIAVLLICLAAGLRFWKLDQLGLTHFDEGSFTMAGRWLATLGAEGHPPQPQQAPGLTPAVQGLFFLLFGVRDFVAIALSAAAGSLLAGVLYGIGRLWLGRTAGLLAGLFLAGAEYHVIYSRMALTDSLFTLLFWVALAGLFEGIRREDRSWLLAGALATSLCWNTKYHGFMPLAIAALGCFSGFVRRPGGLPRKSLRIWKDLLLAALVTFAGFLPWLLAVAFTTGWSETLIGLWDHSLGQGPWPRTSPRTLLFYLSHWLSPPLLVLALAGCLPPRKRGATGEVAYLRMAVAVFLLSTLFYASFPRLLLPLIPGLCLLAGLGVSRISGLLPVGRVRHAGVAALGLLVVIWSLFSLAPVLQLETDSYRRAAAYLAPVQAPILSQMSKNFYFYEEAHTREMRWLSLEEMNRIVEEAEGTYIVVDPVILRFPAYQAWLEQRKDRLEKVAEFPLRFYDPVRYQSIDPTQPLSGQPGWIVPYLSGQARIEIFRFRR